MQKYANLVELEKCCRTHIFLQNFVLIQPRTSPPKRGSNFSLRGAEICPEKTRIEVSESVLAHLALDMLSAIECPPRRFSICSKMCGVVKIVSLLLRFFLPPFFAGWKGNLKRLRLLVRRNVDICIPTKSLASG